jgi:outer membrane autotransporter protein
MPLRAATLAILCACGLAVALSTQAATFTVSNTNDTGTGSLRQAVIDANDSADASNTIAFSVPASSTINLASPLENITSPTLIFDATASSGLAIDGSGTTEFLTFTTSSTSAQFHPNVSYTDGILTFDESDTGTIDGSLRGGDLTLIKTGAGTTTLSAGSDITLSGPSAQVRLSQGTFVMNGNIALTGATSAVNVEQGTFIANGTLSAATLLVASQATLAGNTAIGALAADTTVQGRLAPSGTTGVLSFTGPLRFASTSVLDVDVQPGGGDLVDVTTGPVTVDPGAAIVFRANPSDFSSAQSVTVLSASSPISGSFTLVPNDFAFLDTALDLTDPDRVQIAFTPNARTFSSFAGTPNQQAVAQHIESASVGASGDLADALDEIRSSTAAEMPGLFDAIGGESLTAFATARQILAERTARAIHRRARDPAWGDGRAFYLSEEPDVAAQGDHGDERPPLARIRPSAWLDALGLYGKLEGNRGEADVDTLLYGGMLGVDAWIADGWVAGLAAGYARSDIDLHGRDTDGYGDTIQGALYAGFTDPRGYLTAYGRYAYTFESSTRRIESSTLFRRARADWDAQDYGAGGELGVTVASFGGFALQPIAGVDWLRLTEESYTESGAGSLGLVVDPETLDTTTAHFGARVLGRLDMGKAGVLAPELRAFYQHVYGDRERVLDARLSGAPGLTSIGVRGPEIPRENFLLGAGWGVLIGEHLTVSLDYDAVLGRDRVEHQGTVAARVVF